MSKFRTTVIPAAAALAMVLAFAQPASASPVGYQTGTAQGDVAALQADETAASIPSNSAARSDLGSVSELEAELNYERTVRGLPAAAVDNSAYQAVVTEAADTGSDPNLAAVHAPKGSVAGGIEINVLSPAAAVDDWMYHDNCIAEGGYSTYQCGVTHHRDIILNNSPAVPPVLDCQAGTAGLACLLVWTPAPAAGATPPTSPAAASPTIPSATATTVSPPSTVAPQSGPTVTPSTVTLPEAAVPAPVTAPPTSAPTPPTSTAAPSTTTAARTAPAAASTKSKRADTILVVVAIGLLVLVVAVGAAAVLAMTRRRRRKFVASTIVPSEWLDVPDDASGPQGTVLNFDRLSPRPAPERPAPEHSPVVVESRPVPKLPVLPDPEDEPVVYDITDSNRTLPLPALPPAPLPLDLYQAEPVRQLIGVVGLADLAAVLDAAGVEVIADDRKAMEAKLTSGWQLPIVIADTDDAGVEAWARQVAAKTRVVLVRAAGAPAIQIEGTAEAVPPVSVSRIVDLAHLLPLEREGGEAVVQNDGHIHEVPLPAGSLPAGPESPAFDKDQPETVPPWALGAFGKGPAGN